MLSNLTVILPLATALFALFWFLRWIRIHKRTEESFLPGQRRFFEKKDWIALGMISPKAICILWMEITTH